MRRHPHPFYLSMTQKDFDTIVKQIQKEAQQGRKRNYFRFIKSLESIVGEAIREESGSFRETLIFDDIVIKRAEGSTSNSIEMQNIMAFRNNRYFKKYFPLTALVRTTQFGNLIVQERVPWVFDAIEWSEEFLNRQSESSKLVDFHLAFRSFAERYLGVGDCKSNNCGLRRDGSVVIFDVHLSSSESGYDIHGGGSFESYHIGIESGLIAIPKVTAEFLAAQRKIEAKRKKIKKILRLPKVA